jgi:hypothetical protein
MSSNANSSAPKPDKLSKKDLQQRFGIAAAVLKEFPEVDGILKKIMADAKRGVIYEDKDIVAMLRGTKWMQRHTEDFIKIEKDRLAKAPEIWDAIVRRRTQDVMRQFQAAGAEIDESLAETYAKQLIYGSGWNGQSFDIFDDKWLKRMIGGAIDFTKTRTINGVEMVDLMGEAQTNAQSLYDLAYNYGIDSSMTNDVFSSWFEKGIRGLASGEQTLEDLTPVLQQEAMSRFPGLTPQLKRGLTLREAANPYMKMIADTLELDVNQVNLNDDLVQRILNSQGSDGSPSALSLYDAKKMARRDDRWQYTSTAKKEYTDMAGKILRDFGFLG